MKKIILGLLQTTLTPFIIIIGYYAISFFETPQRVEIFAGVMGSITIVINWLIGVLLIIKGYQEVKAFKDWD